MIAELAGAARGLLGLALFAAILVLLGALAYAQAERRREAALLRALGISRRELGGLMALEWLLLALVAGTMLIAVANTDSRFRELMRSAYSQGMSFMTTYFTHEHPSHQHNTTAISRMPTVSGQ